MDHKQWFSEAKFGMMIHWGLYAIPAGEWKGHRTNQIGEWLQAYYRIPNAEYEKLAGIFNPIYFNAEEWVLLAKEAGMKYVVITSKHHDGFAMFHSSYDKFNIVDATPFGRDVIAELSAACHKHGLKFGLYYSQDLDWKEPDGGGYTTGKTHVGIDGWENGGIGWTNDWDFPDADKKDYTRCFEGKIKHQMKELLTKYGTIDLIWCDTPMTISPEQGKELYDMIKFYQPECLINSRIGNGLGDYHSCGDNEIDFDQNSVDKNEISAGHNGLYECPATLNDTWGFKYFDDNWKSAEELISIKNRLNQKGVNYLLNVGPDALGRIPAPAVEILRQIAKVYVSEGRETE